MKKLIKKRILLSVLTAIIVCCICYKYWYKVAALPVDFKISGSGLYNIEVLLNRKDNSEFKKVRTDSVKVNINEINKVSFNVPSSRNPKRLKFVFTPKNPDFKIIISDIELKGGKLKLDNLYKFSSKNAEIKIENNCIVLLPHPRNAIPIENLTKKNSSFELIYDDTINIKSSIHIDYLILIIIFILTFLLVYKQFNYIADLNKIDKKSKTDIFFLITFFIILFIPMIHLNEKNYSDIELRPLGKFPNLMISKYYINENFGKEFNEAFNDRFFTREPLVVFFSNLKYYLHTKYSDVHLGYVYKDSDWMFINKSKNLLNDSLTPFTEEQLNKITSNIKKLIDWGKENNIKVYIAVVPSKEYIYQEEDVYHANYKQENAEKLVEKIKKELNYDIIYPINELKKLKKEDYVYFKIDHHLTDTGAYEFYKIIMHRIQKDFPDIEITPISKFNVSYNKKVRHSAARNFDMGGGARSLIHDKKNLLNYNYKYYDYKDLDKLTIIEKWPMGIHINPDGKYKIFVIGNSMIENLIFFLNTSFRKIKKYRFNSGLNTPKRKTRMDMNAYAPLIKEYNPQILLIVTATGYIFEMEDMYP